jgi:hypothetical protein
MFVKVTRLARHRKRTSKPGVSDNNRQKCRPLIDFSASERNKPPTVPCEYSAVQFLQSPLLSQRQAVEIAQTEPFRGRPGGSEQLVARPSAPQLDAKTNEPDGMYELLLMQEEANTAVDAIIEKLKRRIELMKQN